MDVATLQLISQVAYILAGLLFAVAVLLFVVYRIPEVYGEISGRTAKKAIETLRLQSSEGGARARGGKALTMPSFNNSYEPGTGSGTTTGSGRASGRFGRFGKPNPLPGLGFSGPLSGQVVADNSGALPGEETEILPSAELLATEEETVLPPEGEETVLLSEEELAAVDDMTVVLGGEGETTVLLEEDIRPKQVIRIVEDLTYVNTEEEIDA